MSATEPERRRFRVLGLLGRAALAALVLSLFGAATAGGLVLHLDLPASRRVVARVGGELLTQTLHGEVEIEGLSRISTRGIALDTFRVRDVDGVEVVTLNQVRLRANVPQFIYRAAFGEGQVTLLIDHIRAERTEWTLRPDAEGVPTFIKAITPKPSAPSRTPRTPGTGRRVRTYIPTIEIGRAFGRGQVAGLPIVEVSLRSVKGSLFTSPKGLAIDIRRFGASLRGVGGADARGTGDLHIRAPGAVWSNFDGHFGELEIGAFVKFLNKNLTLKLDLPRAEPEQVRALYADWPLHKSVQGRIEASGKLPTLKLTSNLTIGPSQIETRGDVTLSRDFAARLNVVLKKADLRAVLPGAPDIRINAESKVDLWTRDGKLVADFNGKAKATRISGLLVPVVDWTATYDQRGLEGTATLHEPGVPVKTRFHVHPNGAIDLAVEAKPFRIHRAPRLRRHARGLAAIKIDAHIEDQRFSATYNGTVTGLGVGQVRVGSGRLSGSARGPLDSLDKITIHARAAGTKISAGSYGFGKYDVSARGQLTRPRVTARFGGGAAPDVRLSARVTPPLKHRPTRLDKIELELKKGDTAIHGTALRLDVSDDRLLLSDLNLKGAGGALRGSVELTPTKLQARLKGDNVDLGKLSRALGMPRSTLEGKLTIDADVWAGKNDAGGTFRVGLGNASVAGFGGISLAAQGTVARDSFSGNAQVALADIASFGAVWDASIEGSAMEVSSWKEALGSATIQADQINLSLLQLLLARSGVERIDGNAWMRVELQRTKKTTLPSAVFFGGTRGLRVMVQDPTDPDERLDYKDIKLSLSGRADGESGKVVLGSDATGERPPLALEDSQGSLAELAGSTVIDFKRLLVKPREAIAALVRAPLDVTLSLMPRALAKLPAPFAFPEAEGVLRGTVRVTGTAEVPRLQVQAALAGWRPRRSRLASPANIQVEGSYQADLGRFLFDSRVQTRGREVASYKGQGSAPWAILSGKRTPADDTWWSLTSFLRLDRLPLGAFDPFADRGVRGQVSGALSAKRQGNRPLLVGGFDLQQLEVDRVKLVGGNLGVMSNGGMVKARLRLVDSSGDFDAEAAARLSWVGLIPEIDERRGVQLEGKASRFDAVILQPILGDLFSRISGLVDGSARVLLTRKKAEDPDAEEERPWDANLSGNARVTKGVLHIAKMGLQLEDVEVNIRVQHIEGKNVINVQGLQAKARSELYNVKGGARLVLDGLELSTGKGSLAVTDMPLLVEGVSMGEGTGTARFELERDRKRGQTNVVVEIPRFEAKLPQSSARTVFALRENPDIVIKQHIRKPGGGSDEEPEPWNIEIALGNDVRVTRGDGLEVYFRGRPVIRLEQELEIDGYIELTPGGRIPTLNKAFAVERGIVSFDTPVATNPGLNVSAAWHAPDDTTLYIDVTGTLEDAKLALRSNPPRSQPEIYKLLLGGVETTSASSTPEGDGAITGNTAVSVGGGVAFITLNELLTGTPLSGFSFGTERSDSSRSWSAGYRASSKLYVSGTYLEADDSIDDSGQDGVSGTVDWRFQPNWSLRTMVGVTGTAVDLVWQYRY